MQMFIQTTIFGIKVYKEYSSDFADFLASANVYFEVSSEYDKDCKYFES